MIHGKHQRQTEAESGPVVEPGEYNLDENQTVVTVVR